MLPSQRALFDIPEQVCYLNAAAVGPLPRAVKAAGEVGVARKAQPWAIEPGNAQRQFERARAAAARLINADPDDVALISSVSYGIATAGKVLTVPIGSRVLLLQDDHSSPVLEWLDAPRRKALSSKLCRVRTMAIGPRGCSPRSIGGARRRSEWRRSPRCTGRTAVLSISTASPPR
jgi:selenocysteine lyase/cysteine desulfurase